MNESHHLLIDILFNVSLSGDEFPPIIVGALLLFGSTSLLQNGSLLLMQHHNLLTINQTSFPLGIKGKPSPEHFQEDVTMPIS
jgi:hypothetical protein